MTPIALDLIETMTVAQAEALLAFLFGGGLFGFGVVGLALLAGWWADRRSKRKAEAEARRIQALVASQSERDVHGRLLGRFILEAEPPAPRSAPRTSRMPAPVYSGGAIVSHNLSDPERPQRPKARTAAPRPRPRFEDDEAERERRRRHETEGAAVLAGMAGAALLAEAALGPAGAPDSAPDPSPGFVGGGGESGGAGASGSWGSPADSSPSPDFSNVDSGSSSSSFDSGSSGGGF